MAIHLSNKHSQKLLDNNVKKSKPDAIKTVSKKWIQKTEEVTGHFIGNKIEDKITRVLKKVSQEIAPSTERNWNTKIKIYISWKQTGSYWWIKISIKI